MISESPADCDSEKVVDTQDVAKKPVEIEETDVLVPLQVDFGPDEKKTEPTIRPNVPSRSYQVRQARMLEALVLALAVATCVYVYLKFKVGSEWEQALGWSVVVSRLSAIVFAWMFAFTLLSMCRMTIARMPAWLMTFVPVDHLGQLHKVLGYGSLLTIITHTIGHVISSFKVGTDPSKFLPGGGIVPLNSTIDVFKNLRDATKLTTVGYLTGTGAITGYALTLIMFMMALTAMCRSRWFTLFLRTHLGVYLIVLLLYFHSWDKIFNGQFPIVTIIITPAVVVFAIDCLMRWSSSWQHVFCTSIAVVAPKLLRVRLQQPKHFVYKEGQFFKIMCPQISLEWHSFTMTSLPSDPFLECYIASNGDWTNALHKQATLAVQQEDSTSPSPSLLSRPWRVCGPYYAPVVKRSEYDIQIFVGLGIGITPFFASLRSYVGMLHSRPNDDKHVLGVFSCRNSVWLSVLGRLLNQFKSDFAESLRQKGGQEHPTVQTSVSAPNVAIERRPSQLSLLNVRTQAPSARDLFALEDEDAQFEVDFSAYQHRNTSNIQLKMHFTGPKAEAMEALGPDNTMHVDYTRPDFVRILREHQDLCVRDGTLHPRKVGVFYCGPPRVEQAVAAALKECNCDLFRYKLHAEEFG